MSDIVDFKLTLNDKEFSTTIKNAGNLLETFGKRPLITPKKCPLLNGLSSPQAVRFQF